MEKTDNQEVINYRDRLRERMSSRYPERNFSSVEGQEGQNVQDDLDKALFDALDEYDAKLEKSDSANRRLTDLFNSDPKSAAFLNRWVEKGDPLVALIDTFGEDLKEALDNPENRQRFEESHAKWLEAVAADEAASKEADMNFEQSLKTSAEVCREMGIEDELMPIVKIREMAERALQGEYTREDMIAVINSERYNADVEKARNDGMVAGRNAKIDEMRKYRRDTEANMPPSLTAGASAQPEKKKSKVASMFGLD